VASLTDIIKATFGSKFRVSRGYIPGHDGIDIAAKEGTPVYAVASGVVEYARDARKQGDKGAKGWAMGGGNVVNIDVGNGLATQYAHLQSFVVHEGQRVAKGQLIGYVGRTGGTTASGQFGGPGAEFVGAHVHFGLWDHKKNKMVNPTAFLAQIGQVVPKKTGDVKADDWQVDTLGAWNNIVKFPVGHIITVADVDKMMEELDKAGYFKSDPAFLNVGRNMTREILMTAVGKAWDKPLQEDLQRRFGAAAESAGEGFGIATGIADFGNTIVKLATYLAALVLVVVGLWLYSRSGYGQAA
jgi:hypothetical protein